MYLDPFKMDPVFGNNHPTSRLIMQSENNSYTDTFPEAANWDTL